MIIDEVNLTVNFHELKAMYLGIPVSSKMLNYLDLFSKAIEYENLQQIIHRIDEALNELSEMISFMKERMEPVDLDGLDFSFTCNCCGRCCEQFAIGVAREDIERILEGDCRILPFLTLAENRPTFQFFNKKMFKANDLIYPPALIAWIEELNPSLAKIASRDLSSCIFYNSIDRTCTIYDLRPAECMLYPIGNKIMGMTNLLCDASCFDQGAPINMYHIQTILDENRVSDAAFLALYQLNPQGGWRKSAFKLALLFDRLAYLA